MSFLSQEEIESLKPKMMVSRIILGALSLGVLVFAAIALTVTLAPLHWDIGILQIFGLVFTASSLVGWFVVPWVMPIGTGLVGETKCEGAQGALLTQSIIRGALVEGAAFFNIVFLMAESSGINLAVALVCLPFLLALIPFGAGYIKKIERILAD